MGRLAKLILFTLSLSIVAISIFDLSLTFIYPGVKVGWFSVFDNRNTSGTGSLKVFVVLSIVMPLAFLLLLQTAKKALNASSFYSLSLLTLLVIPFQQLFIGLLTRGQQSFFSVGCRAYTIYSREACNLLSNPLTTILAMAPLVLLAFRLFKIGEARKATLEHKILAVLNLILGIGIVLGYTWWNIAWFFRHY